MIIRIYYIEVLRQYQQADINQDSSVDRRDLEILAGYYNSNETELRWDDNKYLNQDVIIHIFDLVQISNQIN